MYFKLPLTTLATIAAMGATTTVEADDTALRLSSGPARVALLELYTSEGCSSCPPADRWLSGLKADEGLWEDFVPIALHVDYWDHIGWPDRFAQREFSDRQRRYAAEGGARIVYTPGVMVDGREWRGWRSARPQVSAGGGGVLDVVVDGSRLEARFTASGDADTRTLHVALLGMGLSTDVAAGENRGRRLIHDFVVLDIERLPLAEDEAGWHAIGTLPARADRDRQYAVAAWVTADGKQAPEQAAGGYLTR